MRSTIEIKGARENNLKNVSVEIPREKLIVVTGVSGSGKSSLAFDVLFGEGQRRFMESLSAYARTRIPQVKRPKVDFVKGLSPVLSISQSTGVKNPRSTVGTITETQSYLRLLFSAIGIPYCPYCGSETQSKTVHQIAEHIETLPGGTEVEILAPMKRIYGENYEFLLDEVRNSGCRDVRIDGELRSTSDRIELDEEQEYRIEALVDRFVLNGDQTKQIAGSLQRCHTVGEGFIRIHISNADEVGVAPEKFMKGIACEEHNVVAADLLPWYFSPNESDSACRTCLGLGTYLRAEAFLLVVDPEKSIRQGALERFVLNPDLRTFKRIINWPYVRFYSMAEHFGFSLDTPFKDLPEKIKEILFYGTQGEKIELLKPPEIDKDHKNFGMMVSDSGILDRVDRWYKRTSKQRTPKDYEERMAQRLMVENDCPDCHGTKLKEQRLLIRINGRSIHDLGLLSLRDLRDFMDSVEVEESKAHIAAPIVAEVKKRLDLMIGIGLDYLNLNRRADTLSGGELQRTRLTTQIGSELMGMLVVLDEPSIGLHPRDTLKIVSTLKDLRDIGNTVVVIEHDVDTIKSADHIIEMGPGPGLHGGNIVSEGPVEVIEACADSVTGQYLSGARTIAVPSERRKSNGKSLAILGASANNLRNVDVEIPLGLLVAITGVSGSGKSSLIDDILHKRLRQVFRDRRIIPGPHDRVDGIEHLRDVRNIDQSPIGKSSRSSPATYIGIYDRIRKIFSELPESKNRGYTYSDFSFNQTSAGRCAECKGVGFVTTELQYMADVVSVCPACKGARFSEEILEIKYRGKSIAEVLDMTVEEAEVFFADTRLIQHKLAVMRELGLGYLTLGQPATQLSGGEAQRVKLARELGKIKRDGDNLYILDEPTTGLHLADIQRLLDCLNRLVDAGNTVLVIEHHVDVIKSADYVIDLGPGGGVDGGEVVAAGTPESVAKSPDSFTGEYLRAVLAN
ncbi:MAG: excinuclease ABC subunit UvrA [Candidatus Thorarchaeota archaeon]|nr:MAG: excinuclease ABC subunit UvrA [Candidatus Thorarchaeota archaeon]